MKRDNMQTDNMHTDCDRHTSTCAIANAVTDSDIGVTQLTSDRTASRACWR